MKLTKPKPRTVMHGAMLLFIAEGVLFTMLANQIDSLRIWALVGWLYALLFLAGMNQAEKHSDYWYDRLTETMKILKETFDVVDKAVEKSRQPAKRSAKKGTSPNADR